VEAKACCIEISCPSEVATSLYEIRFEFSDNATRLDLLNIPIFNLAIQLGLPFEQG
jgi:hypothetical protein